MGHFMLNCDNFIIVKHITNTTDVKLKIQLSIWMTYNYFENKI